MVSTIKTVVLVVTNLDNSRSLYEKGLNLICCEETKTTFKEIGKLWGIDEGSFRVARFKRDGEEFGCLDLVENTAAAKKIRNADQPYDFGLMTLNFRTNNLEKAIENLEKYGAQSVSAIQEYNIGKPMRETMLITPSGERLTIIEIGGKDDTLPLFSGAIATAGFVIPKMSVAKNFYEKGFGLETAITFQAEGSPFDALLGVKQLNKLDFATLTAEGKWVGKVELLELEVGGKKPQNTNELTDFVHTGYTFATFCAENLDAVAESCLKNGAEIIVHPQRFNRPFHEGKRAMIARSPGGEYLEIIEN